MGIIYDRSMFIVQATDKVHSLPVPNVFKTGGCYANQELRLRDLVSPQLPLRVASIQPREPPKPQHHLRKVSVLREEDLVSAASVLVKSARTFKKCRKIPHYREVKQNIKSDTNAKL